MHRLIDSLRRQARQPCAAALVVGSLALTTLASPPAVCLKFTSGAPTVSPAAGTTGGSLSAPGETERKSSLEKLKEWNSGGNETLDRLNRGDPRKQVEPERVVMCVVGVTGSGKSSTANTLCGRQYAQFARSSALTSVTKAVSYRDYDFMEGQWRIIDTPGLKDTNLPPEAIRGELLRLASFAPHGISAFIVVLPRGRFTPEQEQALKDLIDLFGEENFYKHALVAVTSATDLSEGRNLLPRNMLIDEINALPLDHLLRRFVEKVSYRLVPVENRADTQRQISRLLLHQRALELEQANGGVRYDPSQIVQRAESIVARSATAADLDRLVALHSGISSPAHGLHLGPCFQRFEKRAAVGGGSTDGASLASNSHHERLRFILECDVGISPPPSSPSSPYGSSA
jgi:AIG1 family